MFQVLFAVIKLEIVTLIEMKKKELKRRHSDTNFRCVCGVCIEFS